MAQQQTTAAEVLKGFEGFSSKPYWDVNAWRIGYGSDTITKPDGTVVRVKPGMTVSKADAQRDLERRIPEFQREGVVPYVGEEAWQALPESTKAAVTSLAYNYGSLAKLPSLTRAIQSGDVNAIADAVAARAADNDGINKERRLQEAQLIRSKPIPPANIPQVGTELSTTPAAPTPAGMSPALAAARKRLTEARAKAPTPATASPGLAFQRNYGDLAAQVTERTTPPPLPPRRPTAPASTLPPLVLPQLPRTGESAPQPRPPYGMIEKGNIDPYTRPQVRNAGGSISTVRSVSFGVDGAEVLMPTVSPDGRIMSDEEAIERYYQTGEHLGKFTTPQAATMFASNLHDGQNDYYRSKGGGPQVPLDAATGLAVDPAGLGITPSLNAPARQRPVSYDATYSDDAAMGPNRMNQQGLGALLDERSFSPATPNTLQPPGVIKTADGIAGTVQLPRDVRPNVAMPPMPAPVQSAPPMFSASDMVRGRAPALPLNTLSRDSVAQRQAGLNALQVAPPAVPVASARIAQRPSLQQPGSSSPNVLSQTSVRPTAPQPKRYQAGGYVYTANASGGFTKVGRVSQQPNLTAQSTAQPTRSRSGLWGGSDVGSGVASSTNPLGI